jgi:hypothetical protein
MDIVRKPEYLLLRWHRRSMMVKGQQASVPDFTP